MHCKSCGETVGFFRFLLRYRTVVRTHQSCNPKDQLLHAFELERLLHATAPEEPTLLLPRSRRQPVERSLMRIKQPSRPNPSPDPVTRLDAQREGDKPVAPAVDLSTHSWRCTCMECMAADRQQTAQT